MTLALIGSGLGRPGTISTKMTLERLGPPLPQHGQVMGNPAQPALLATYAVDENVDFPMRLG